MAEKPSEPPLRQVEVQHGLCSWTDETLDGTWYPKQACKTSVDRLVYYSQHYPMVEVDSSNYAIPPRDRVAKWVQQTPKKFVFHFKAFQLFTQLQLDDIQKLPGAIKSKLPSHLTNAPRPSTHTKPVSLSDLGEEIVDEIWAAFNNCLQPAIEQQKMGVVLFQMATNFAASPENIQWLVTCRSKLRSEVGMAVEFRHGSWLAANGPHLESTLQLLARLRICLVCVDETVRASLYSRGFGVAPQTNFGPVSKVDSSGGNSATPDALNESTSGVNSSIASLTATAGTPDTSFTSSPITVKSESASEKPTSKSGEALVEPKAEPKDGPLPPTKLSESAPSKLAEDNTLMSQDSTQGCIAEPKRATPLRQPIVMHQTHLEYIYIRVHRREGEDRMLDDNEMFAWIERLNQFLAVLKVKIEGQVDEDSTTFSKPFVIYFLWNTNWDDQSVLNARKLTQMVQHSQLAKEIVFSDWEEQMKKANAQKGLVGMFAKIAATQRASSPVKAFVKEETTLKSEPIEVDEREAKTEAPVAEIINFDGLPVESKKRKADAVPIQTSNYAAKRAKKSEPAKQSGTIMSFFKK